MRNLKRVLSLALALVMVLGMMVITTSAADFGDADEITKTEAVDVISAIGVITGDNGNFYPNRALTREEGAAFICYLLMGKDAADKLVGSGNFTDVKADRWSAGEIDYCANLGIVKGVGNGQFNPKGELTAVQFGGMLLGALGYDGNVEGYTGGNWATAIAADMLDIGLNVKNVEMDAVLTREQAAQMALQALECDMVEYDDKGTNITIGGVEITTGADKAEAIANATDAAGDYAGDADDDTLQFCEKYFKDLKKVKNGTDNFGRPLSHTWTLKNKPVNVVAKKASVTFTEADSPVVVAKALSGYKFNGNKINNVYTVVADTTIDGVTVDLGETVAAAIKDELDNGKLVEIYTNPVTKEITDIIEINYTTTIIDNIVTNKTTGNVTYTLAPGGSKVAYADEDVDDEIVFHGDVAKKDVVTVTTDDYGVVHVYPTTKVQGAQSAYKTNFGVRTITVAGTEYKVGAASTLLAVTAYGNSVIPANYYVDQYGFVVYTDAIRTAASTDYAYILDVDEKTVISYSTTTPVVKVKALLADGSLAEYTVAVEYDRDDSTWYVEDSAIAVYASSTFSASTNLKGKTFGYTVNEDGNLVLETLNAASGSMVPYAVYVENDVASINPKANQAGTYTLLNDETVFVVYNSVKKTVTAYTAAEAEAAFSAITTADAVITASSTTAGMATVVFAETSSAATATNVDIIYVDDAYTVRYDAKTKGNIYVYTGVTADGEEVEQTTARVELTKGLYERKSDNKLTASEYKNPSDSSTDEYIYATGITVEAGMLNISGTFYTYANAKVVDLTQAHTGIDAEGFTAYIVLKKVGPTVTADAATIYVVDAPRV